MTTDMLHEQWLRAYIMSPAIHYDMSTAALDDEWAMWNNGGEL